MKCSLPSSGWWCSREPGHEGPCAARRTYNGFWYLIFGFFKRKK